MKIGDKVKYTGTSIEHIRWGSNDDPRGVLAEGGIYTIKKLRCILGIPKYI